MKRKTNGNTAGCKKSRYRSCIYTKLCSNGEYKDCIKHYFDDRIQKLFHTLIYGRTFQRCSYNLSNQFYELTSNDKYKQRKKHLHTKCNDIRNVIINILK